MEPWEELARQLRTTLAETPPTGAPAVEGEAGFDVGATSVDVVIESSGSSAEEQSSSTALIQIASSRDSITDEVAATALIEIDELIERALREAGL